MKNSTRRTAIPQSNPSRHRGFTLVELLVVITIIVVMAALIVVVTQKVRAKAYQANALSALRQVAGFNTAYTAENNGDINTLRWDTETKTEGPKGGNTYVINTFWGRLHPYLCPDVDTRAQPNLRLELKQRLDSMFNTDTDSGNPKDPQGQTMPGTIVSGSRIYRDISGLAIPFGFNDELHEFNQVVKVSSVGNPSQILYITYGFGFFKEADGQTYVARPTDKTSKPIYYLDDRKALVAFLDGHIETLAPPIPQRYFK